VTRRVLIVEDEAAISEALTFLLEKEGFVVSAEHTGKAGLAAARATDFDALIIDLLLPDVSGAEVCARLREDGSEVSILLLTARSHEDAAAQASEARATAFMTKPFEIQDLLARLRTLLPADV